MSYLQLAVQVCVLVYCTSVCESTSYVLLCSDDEGEPEEDDDDDDDDDEEIGEQSDEEEQEENGLNESRNGNDGSNGHGSPVKPSDLVNICSWIFKSTFHKSFRKFCQVIITDVRSLAQVFVGVPATLTGVLVSQLFSSSIRTTI